MRRLPYCKLCVIIISLILLSVLYIYLHLFDNITIKNIHRVPKDWVDKDQRIVLSFVACDTRFNESLNVVKSALTFTRKPIHLVVFTQDILKPQFQYVFDKWRNITTKLTYEIHRINFPKEHAKEWLNLFGKCAAQRLFMPDLLPHIDSLIYVDTDTLFLGPIDELWNIFSQFNSTQMCALAVEDERPNISWYPRFAKHPFYGELGLNSGVVLMNLTSMRSFGWGEYITPVMLKYKLYITWGDQDIINVILHYHGEAVHVLECRFNYRTDQCMYGDACGAARTHGVLVLHGSRGVFHNNKQPAFEAIYRAFDEYKLDTNPISVIYKIDKYLREAPKSNCGNLKDFFLKVPSKLFNYTNHLREHENLILNMSS